jgi:class 3 adenylate cyclase/HAMP domain-containing protein
MPRLPDAPARPRELPARTAPGGRAGFAALRHRLSPARSFGAKLLAAMLAAVGLLSLVALLVVRSETARQVDRVSVHTAQRARDAFAAIEELQQAQLARLASAFTGSRRAIAALESALEENDLEFIAGQLDYELRLVRADGALATFADARGEPLLTLMDGRAADPDPGRIAPLAAELLATGEPERLTYRVVAGRLYLVEVAVLELLAGVPVGVVAFGLPLEDQEAGKMAAVVGAEVCFVAHGECLAGTAAAKGALAPWMRAAVTLPRPARAADGSRWKVVAEPLSADDPDAATRVVGVPLDPVLEPFDRVQRALMVGGAAALLLAVLLSALLARGLTQPVRELVDATQAVARGELDRRVRVRSRDELGELGASFNEMTHGLMLKEQYRGVLDKVVSRDVAEELLRGEIALGGEIREASTLFADIDDFTATTEGMGPADVIGMLNEVMERLSTAVEAEGGVVDKYIGDGIMAVFGAPNALPEHALRAVRAGLRMAAAMADLNVSRTTRRDVALRLAIGIDSGRVLAGNMGSPDRLNYTVLGESVNLASRICGAADGGELLVSEATLRQVEAHVIARPLGARDLKGFSRSVRLWAVDGVAGDTRPPAHPVAAGAAAPDGSDDA